MSFVIDEEAFRNSREWLAELLSGTEEPGYSSNDHWREVVLELQESLEELWVAEEELRAQAEELAASSDAIDAERERYAELFDFAPDAYLVTDGHGKIFEANRAASRMLGVPSRFLNGKLLVSFVAEEQRRELRNFMKVLREDGESNDELYVDFQPREGETFVAAVRAVSRGGEPSSPGVRWMIRDVTSRLGLEAEVAFLSAEVEILASLGQVAQLTAKPQSVDSLLERVTGLVCESVPGCEISVALATDGGVRFASCSGYRAGRLDEAEKQEGDGPCVTAMRQGDTVHASREECKARWPVFGGVAEELALDSAHGYPIATPGGRRGALNIYAFEPVAHNVHRVAPLLVDQVRVSLENAELYESAHLLSAQLQGALDSRAVIEQAKGVLIARQGCSDDRAFDMLRRASQRLNRKLRDIAVDLVSSVQDGSEEVNPEGLAK